MEPSCLFCLEAVKEISTPSPLGCQCKVVAHEACFKTWFDQKQQMECPICHSISMPNRIVHENIHIVYVNTREQEDRRLADRFRQQEKAALFCCLLIMGWTVGITILELIASS